MPFKLPSLCQRHPRYSLAIFLLFLCTCFLLHPDVARHPIPVVIHSDPGLRGRLDRAEQKYQDMLGQRKDLIAKFGPTPAQVTMFPPDHDPWPAYTVWDFFPPVFNCPHELDRLGSIGDGGKWVCGLSRIADEPDCVVYSFGVDSSSEFEAAFLASTRYCQVWAYDYTHNPGADSQIPKSLRHRVHYGKIALGAVDRHGSSDEPKMWTLKSLMEHNGHTHIDFLRVDIEGWEWEVFRNIVRDFTEGGAVGQEEGKSEGARAGVLPFAQLQIELHVWHQRFPDFLAWWEMLEAAGLRPFMNEINLVYANYNRQSGVELAEYSFLNIKGENAFTTDAPLPSPVSPPPGATEEGAQNGLVRHMIIVIAYFLILLRTRRWMKTFIT